MVISSVALAVSLLVTVIKFVDWISHSDPRTIVRMGRLGLLALAVTSVPALVSLLALEQWTGAMLLGAAMLLATVLINWRLLAPRVRFRPMWVEGDPPGSPQRNYPPPVPDAELARRAAIVLQDYLAHVGRQEPALRIHGPDEMSGDPSEQDDGPMSADEARAVLGLTGEPTSAQVRTAHRRLMQLVHPDRGGSDYLAMKINRAKDVLLQKPAANIPPAGAKVSTATKTSRATKASRGTKASRATRTSAGKASD